MLPGTPSGALTDSPSSPAVLRLPTTREPAVFARCKNNCPSPKKPCTHRECFLSPPSVLSASPFIFTTFSFSSRWFCPDVCSRGLFSCLFGRLGECGATLVCLVPLPSPLFRSFPVPPGRHSLARPLSGSNLLVSSRKLYLFSSVHEDDNFSLSPGEGRPAQTSRAQPGAAHIGLQAPLRALDSGYRLPCAAFCVVSLSKLPVPTYF